MRVDFSSGSRDSFAHIKAIDSTVLPRPWFVAQSQSCFDGLEERDAPSRLPKCLRSVSIPLELSSTQLRSIDAASTLHMSWVSEGACSLPTGFHKGERLTDRHLSNAFVLRPETEFCGGSID